MNSCVFPTLFFLLFFGFASLPSWCFEVKNPAWQIDTLPDGRYLWEMTSYEKAIFYGDPMETEMERQWRVEQADEMGLTNMSLTASERLYLLGQKFSVALPSSRLLSGAAVADDLVRSGNKAGQHLIRLKDAAPQL